MVGLAELQKPLLRPTQIREAQEELRNLDVALQAPPYIASQTNRGEMAKRARVLRRDLDSQTPQPYREGELDDAARAEKSLREAWMQGMPTQAEMRRNPAGAADKHRRWETHNKAKIMAWKHVMLRLHASSPGAPTPGTNEKDLCNIERFRPAGASHELNMHNEQIPGRDFHMPFRPQSVVMNDDESDALKQVAPDLHAQMATLGAELRAEILGAVRDMLAQAVAQAPATASSPSAMVPVSTTYVSAGKSNPQADPDWRAERARLQAICDERGLNYDPRWGPSKLTRLLNTGRV